jgi:hypothetical protein
MLLNRVWMIPQRFGQGHDDAVLDRNVPRHFALGVFGALGRPGVAGIGGDRALAHQQPALRQRGIALCFLRGAPARRDKRRIEGAVSTRDYCF